MVSTHLKNISQIGYHPQVGVKIKKWNHQLAKIASMKEALEDEFSKASPTPQNHKTWRFFLSPQNMGYKNP